MEATLWRHLVVLALGLAPCAPAHAEVVSRTTVTYFDVAGTTPAEIYASMLERGPRVGKAKALASVEAEATQDADLDQQGGACHLDNYVISLEFVIQRPRMVDEDVLPPAGRAMWTRMQDFIAAHESQHKHIWEDCAHGLERSIATLRAADCDRLGEKAEALWSEMLTRCDARQRAFDEEQTEVLMQQPFMKRALEETR